MGALRTLFQAVWPGYAEFYGTVDYKINELRLKGGSLDDEMRLRDEMARICETKDLGVRRYTRSQVEIMRKKAGYD